MKNVVNLLTATFLLLTSVRSLAANQSSKCFGPSKIGVSRDVIGEFQYDLSPEAEGYKISNMRLSKTEIEILDFPEGRRGTTGVENRNPILYTYSDYGTFSFSFHAKSYFFESPNSESYVFLDQSNDSGGYWYYEVRFGNDGFLVCSGYILNDGRKFGIND